MAEVLGTVEGQVNQKLSELPCETQGVRDLADRMDAFETQLVNWKSDLLTEVTEAAETNMKVCEKLVENLGLRTHQLERDLHGLQAAVVRHPHTPQLDLQSQSRQLDSVQSRLTVLADAAESSQKHVESLERETTDAISSLRDLVGRITQQMTDQLSKMGSQDARFEKIEEKLGLLERGVRRSGRKEKDSAIFQASGTAGRGKHSVLSYFLSPSPEDQLNTNRSGSAMPVLNLSTSLNREPEVKRSGYHNLAQEVKKSPVPSLQLQGLNTNPILNSQTLQGSNILHFNSTDRSEFDPIIEQVSSKEFVAVPRGLDTATFMKLTGQPKANPLSKTEGGPSKPVSQAAHSAGSEKNSLKRSGSNQNLPGGVHPIYNTSLGLFGPESCSSLEDEFKFRLGAGQAEKLSSHHIVIDTGNHETNATLSRTSSAVVHTQLAAKSIKEGHPTPGTPDYITESKTNLVGTMGVQNFTAQSHCLVSDSYNLRSGTSPQGLNTFVDVSSGQNLKADKRNDGSISNLHSVPSAFNSGHPLASSEATNKHSLKYADQQSKYPFEDLSKRTADSKTQKKQPTNLDEPNAPEMSPHKRNGMVFSKALPDNKVPFRQIDIQRSIDIQSLQEHRPTGDGKSDNRFGAEDILLHNLSGSIERLDSVGEHSLSRRLFEEVPAHMLDSAFNPAVTLGPRAEPARSIQVLRDITLQEANKGHNSTSSLVQSDHQRSKSPTASDKQLMQRSQPLLDRKYEALGPENIRIDYNAEGSNQMYNQQRKTPQTPLQNEPFAPKEDKTWHDQSNRSSLNKSQVTGAASKYSAPAGALRQPSQHTGSSKNTHRDDASNSNHSGNGPFEGKDVKPLASPFRQESNRSRQMDILDLSAERSTENRFKTESQKANSEKGFDFESWARENQLLVSGFKYGK